MVAFLIYNGGGDSVVLGLRSYMFTGVLCCRERLMDSDPFLKVQSLQPVLEILS